MPKSIAFERFDFGLDLRKGPSTSDANRLRVLKNGYTSEGRTIRKRPGLSHITTLESGTVGLFAGGGKLNTFYGGTGTITHANTLFNAHNIRHKTSASTPVSKMHFADMFNGYLYCSAEYEDGQITHHYLDGALPGATHIADANCPNTKSVAKISSKIWAVGTNGDTVRFCKTNSPRDWTTSNDAGFLPVGIQQTGASNATALGYYGNKLVVFFADSSQIWTVDVDPLKNAFSQAIDLGSRLPYSHANMSGDVFFLSPAGVRTITRQDVTTNLIDADVGSPIDRELLNGDYIDISNARAQYYRGGGQYWLYNGNKAVVFTFSRTSGVNAWSVYEFPFTIDYMDELEADLYVRSGDDVYKFDRAARTDNGVIYPVEIELSYLDMKAPGILKQIIGMDAVTTGNCEISFRYDPRNTDLVTSPGVTISGDSRPGNVFPVEMLATNLAPVIRNNDDADFELHQIVLYFETLGVM